MKVAICFFGITRSLTHTIGSIETNILSPARASAEVRIFAHFYRQTIIENPRSGENGSFNQDEHKLLNADWLKLEDPDHCLEQHAFEELKTFGDSWNDDFRSLRNLVHQLHSIKEVTDAAMEWSPDLILFVRPDLAYHDSLGREIARASKSSEPAVILPNWQQWEGGYNDRFAICRGVSAACVYGRRVTQMRDFCIETSSSLHSERLLRFGLEKNKIKPSFMSVRASRVRATGELKQEQFAGPVTYALRQRIVRAIDFAGLRPFFTRLRSNTKAR